MIKPYLLVAMMFFLLLGPGRSQAFGGDITLAITTATTVIHTASGGASADQAGIKVTITNRGNESARNLSLQARLFDRKQAVAVAPRLPPGKSVDIAFTMPVPRSLNGSFPLFLEVFYQHPDGRTVSAGSLAVLTTTQREHPPVVALALEQKPSGLGAFVTVHLSTKDPALKEVRLTCYAPAALTVEQGQQMVRMDNGTGTTTFSIAPAKGDLGHYAVFVATEAEVNGSHELVSSSMVVPAVAAKSLVDRVDRATWQRAGYGAAILVLLLWFWSLLPGRRTTADEAGWHTSPRDTGLVDTVVLAAVIIFIIINLNPQYLVTSTVTTGGDTASHYYTLDYLRHQLLPHGKISGWTMGNYAGFPLLQFYFPLPFLLMCLLNVAIPLTVAFKIVTLLGTLLLPITAYLLLRGLQRPFPAPILGAIFTLPFLFHSANSMWGGNILSTLAGEFSYSLSLSLSLILLGAMYYGARHERWVIGNAVLVFLVGFSHGYTLLFVEAVSMFLLIVHDGFIRRFIYLLKVYTLGFLFLAFWLVPLLVFTRFTTSYHLAWTINSWREIVPPQILPFAILAAVGSVVMLWWSGRRRRDSELVTALAYLWFGCIASIVFFIAAPRLGVVDIRYVPYGQLLAVITAALFLGWLTRFLPKNGPLWTIPL
nr:hypothetical protein [Pseudomonadota bacterium]